MLKIKNLSKKYLKNKVLKNLSVNFDNYGVSVIIGTNGSGKTTLFNILTSLITCDSGTISIDDNRLGTIGYKKSIFYLPSDFYLPEYMTAMEYGNFIMSRYSESNSETFLRLLELLGLKNFCNKLIETYSFGMKKKLLISVSLSLNTPYLLADEPFSGLDFETSLLAQNAVKIYANKHKIILVSHEQSTLTMFPEDIYLLVDGQLSTFIGSDKELLDLFMKRGGLSEKIAELEKCFNPL